MKIMANSYHFLFHFLSFAINNTNFNDDAVNGKNEFYGMRIVICQQGTNVNILT